MHVYNRSAALPLRMSCAWVFVLLEINVCSDDTQAFFNRTILEVVSRLCGTRSVECEDNSDNVTPGIFAEA